MATEPEALKSATPAGIAAKARRLAVVNEDIRGALCDRGEELLGRKVVDALTLPDCTDFAAIPGNECVFYKHLGILLIDGQLQALDAADAGAAPGYLRTPEFERYCSPIHAQVRSPRRQASYLMKAARYEHATFDSPQMSWGIDVTEAGRSPLVGKGIRVAVLDSGIDRNHPAFKGVPMTLRSFVQSPPDHDHSGHGTACASIICGRPEKSNDRRIGVAPGIELVVAKIFDESDQSPDARTLAAINWAIEEKCNIVSMSVNGPSEGGYSEIFEAAAQAAREQDVLLIAGAGNDSMRKANIKFCVGHPANCPDVLAVGAIDECRRVANFSNRSEKGRAGAIDLVAPGTRILSAVAGGSYSSKSGTSFATSFVAGIAAMWAGKDETLRGRMLWDALCANAKALPLSGKDVGKGLVQAPR